MNITFLKNSLYMPHFNKPLPAFDTKSSFQNTEKSSQNPFLYHLNALKNYNIAFTSALAQADDETVYVIDGHGNFLKLDSIDDCSSLFGFKKERISKCANGDMDDVNGFVFSYAKNCEIKTRTGTKPDKLMISIAGEVIRSLPKAKNGIPNINEFLAEKLCKELSKDKNLFDRGSEKQKNVNYQEVLRQYSGKKNIPININMQKFFNISSLRSLKLQEKQEKQQKYITVDKIPDEDTTGVLERYLQNPYYILDVNGNHKKLYRQVYLADVLGVSKEAVGECLRGNRKLICGLALQYASDVEKKDENGNITLDFEALKAKFKTEEKEGFYAVDKFKNYHKFNDPKIASETLKVPYNSLLRCLSGHQDTSCGFVFIRASELETIKADGTIKINTRLIDKKVLKINNDAIYLIDSNLKRTRYDNAQKASEDTGFDVNSIKDVANGKRKTVYGFIVLRASEIEKYSKNGTVHIDTEKIKKAYEASLTNDMIEIPEDGFLAINKKGEIKRFYTLQEAEKKLNANAVGISYCLKNLAKSCGGHIYCFPSEIEYTDKKGNKKTNKAKLNEKLQFFKNKAFYSIDKNGEPKYFENQREAEKVLGVSHKTISECLRGNIKRTKEYAFVRALDLETGIIIDGKPELNDKIIKEKVILLNASDKIAVYAINEEDERFRFDSLSDAAEYLKINVSNISACLNPKRNVKTAGGWAFILASKVETELPDGSIDINEEEFTKLRSKFSRKKPTFRNSNEIVA